MLQTLNHYNAYISIGGRPLSNLRFADDVDLLVGTEARSDHKTKDCFKVVWNGNYNRKMQDKDNSLKKCGRTIIKINGQTMEEVEVNTFKYLWSIICSDGSSTNLGSYDTMYHD